MIFLWLVLVRAGRAAPEPAHTHKPLWPGLANVLDHGAVDPIGQWTPFTELGGKDAVYALAHAFYDAMERDEPELTAQHRLTEPGRVHPEVRERFALFLVGWLGGPQDYVAQHGHPRLRMRHARVLVDVAMRDAWLRCMKSALDERGVSGDLRAFLDQRFAEVADFMRNQ